MKSHWTGFDLSLRSGWKEEDESEWMSWCDPNLKGNWERQNERNIKSRRWKWEERVRRKSESELRKRNVKRED